MNDIQAILIYRNAVEKVAAAMEKAAAKRELTPQETWALLPRTVGGAFGGALMGGVPSWLAYRWIKDWRDRAAATYARRKRTPWYWRTAQWLTGPAPFAGRLSEFLKGMGLQTLGAKAAQLTRGQALIGAAALAGAGFGAYRAGGLPYSMRELTAGVSTGAQPPYVPAISIVRNY